LLPSWTTTLDSRRFTLGQGSSGRSWLANGAGQLFSDWLPGAWWRESKDTK
jgi:hypothetical protein